jgi:smad nuclear-interacting protein 1
MSSPPRKSLRRQNYGERSTSPSHGRRDGSFGDNRRYSPSFGPRESPEHKKPAPPPNYNPSGKLVESRLVRDGVLLKYDEPTDAVLPVRKWRLHIFKGPQQVGIIKIGEKSCIRIGRDPKVSDILVEHESCSKQHAVIQHREVVVDKGYGNYETHHRPYIIDLDSTHGTILNGKRIETKRFIELKPTDILKFAYSTREYVVLAEDIVQ